MDWESFLPPFFGVLAAFLIQRGWSWIEDRRAREKLRQDIEKELKSCSDKLVGEGNLLPTDIWKSAVSSGFLKLIPHDHKMELGSIYFRIECHNYEAEKVREVSILAATDKEKAKAPEWRFSGAERLHNALSNRLRESEAALRNDINNLLKLNVWD